MVYSYRPPNKDITFNLINSWTLKKLQDYGYDGSLVRVDCDNDVEEMIETINEINAGKSL